MISKSFRYIVFYLSFVLVVFLGSLDVKSCCLEAQPHQFDLADSLALVHNDHSMYDLRTLSLSLTSGFDNDHDKFRAIYRWVCDNIDNDYGTFTRITAKRKKYHNKPKLLEQWNQKVSPMVFDRLVNKRKTICTGYAYLIKELCNMVGIESTIVNGYARDAIVNIGGEGVLNHSWNAVKLDGRWYLCDATWSSGYFYNGQYVKEFNDTYFLTDPLVFGLNHYPVDQKWRLTNQEKELTQFLNAPLAYKQTLKMNISPLSNEKFDHQIVKGRPLRFSFYQKSSTPLKSVDLVLNAGSVELRSEKKIIQYHQDGYYFIEHDFKSIGRYTVHLMNEGTPLISYKIRVLKAAEAD